jgi:hypothetical protein
VKGEWPRLYFDLEMEYEEEQTPEHMCNVIGEILQIIWLKLMFVTGCSDTDVRLHTSIEMTNHRFKNRDVDNQQMWFLSCHIIFSSVRFQHNDRGMKMFVQKILDPELQQHENLCWMKKCQQKIEQRTIVDQRTYAHEQPFRLIFTSKNKNTRQLLMPYDIDTERVITPLELSEIKRFIDQTLISATTSIQECVLISDLDVSRILKRLPTSKRGGTGSS